MPATAASPAKTAQKAQRELEDLQLVLRSERLERRLDTLLRRYQGFVRPQGELHFLRRRRRGRPRAGGNGRSLQGGS